MQDYSSKEETDEYVCGSAELVGMMCLRVFVSGNDKPYREIKSPARKLSSAFQKVNFLGDIKFYTQLLNRKYFHNAVDKGFTEEVKNEIIEEVEKEFDESLSGLMRLPGNSKVSVLNAYYFYRKLLDRIKKTPSEQLITRRLGYLTLLR